MNATVTPKIPAPPQEGVCPLTTRQIVDRVIMFAEEVNKRTLYAYQVVFARRIVESLLLRDGDVITALFSRQCLDADTVVLRRDGTACRLRDHEAAWSTGVKPTKRYKLRGGAEIVATDNHPVMTDKGWVKAGELRVGDRVSVLDNWDRWAGVPVEPAFAKMLGYFVTDGSMTLGQTPKFTNTTKAYLREFTKLVKTLFGFEPKEYAKGKGADLVCTPGRGVPNGFTQAMRELTWDCGFPTDVFSWSQESVALFVNRAWSGDGCISMKRSGPDVFLACGNEEVYARYWQSLLQKLGIASTVKRERMPKSTGTFHRLVLGSGARNLRRFFAIAGPIYGKEEACREALSYFDRKAKRASGKGRAEREMRTVENIGKDNEALTYARIGSIEDAGEREVFDVVYPGKGWFIAHGVQTHNSGKTEVVGVIALALCLILPALAKEFPNDKRFKGFEEGVRVGIFAPSNKHSAIVYFRMRQRVESMYFQDFLRDPGLNLAIAHSRGDSFAFTNGSIVESNSASSNVLNEGGTYHLIITDESQRLESAKINKELRPMLSSKNGTMVEIGTALAARCQFKKDIDENLNVEKKSGKRNHFQFPYDQVIADRRAIFNKTGDPQHLSYEKWVQKELARLGGNIEDESFKMNFRLMWLEAYSNAINMEKFDKLSHPRIEVGAPWTWPFAQTAGRFAAGIDVARDGDSTWVTVMHVDTANPMLEMQLTQDRGDFDVVDDGGGVFYKKTIVGWQTSQGNFEGDFGQYARIVSFLQRFPGLECVAVDATGMGDAVWERLAVMMPGVNVIPFRYSTPSKHNLYRWYFQEIAAERIQYAGGPATRDTQEYREFVRQHKELVREYRGNYLHVYARDENDHDDAPDSAALAAHAAKFEGMPVVDFGGNSVAANVQGMQEVDMGGASNYQGRSTGRSSRYARRH